SDIAAPAGQTRQRGDATKSTLKSAFWRALMKPLEGRVALVTGASQGIGRACALRLAAQGASVALAARNMEKLRQVESEIAGAGGHAASIAMDVAQEDQIKA